MCYAGLEIWFQANDTLARVIQEELLKDFSTNSQLSNWFEREDVNPPAVVVKKPNPKNIQNADKIKELEEQIQRYIILEHSFSGRADIAKATTREARSQRTSSTTFHSTDQTIETAGYRTRGPTRTSAIRLRT